MIRGMPQKTVRTTVDIPAPIYRRLKQQAAQQGCSVRDLVMHGIERVLLNPERPRRKAVRFPLIDSEGPKVELTDDRLYELIEFP
jgi:hypothetical protein